MHRIVQLKKEEKKKRCIFPDVDLKMITRLFLGGLMITADFYFLPFVYPYNLIFL